METISKVVRDGLCCACGICAGNCPKQCINMRIEDGVVAPVINQDVCIGCGICMKVCSISSINEYEELSEGLEDYILGLYEQILCVKNKDSDVLKNSASGGVVTGIIKTLLNGGGLRLCIPGSRICL